MIQLRNPYILGPDLLWIRDISVLCNLFPGTGAHERTDSDGCLVLRTKSERSCALRFSARSKLEDYFYQRPQR